jgi:lysine N6-hydroxylase
VSLVEVNDLVAVGAGPANLSLAALAQPLENLRMVVLERKASFSWHPGLMVSEAALQTAPLKDLVTLVDPTSHYSFLNFLAEEGRLYRHLIATRESVRRREFNEYFMWAAEQLDSVRFGVEVEMLEYQDEHFVLSGSRGVWRARNVVLGMGMLPSVPGFIEPLLGPHVFHTAEYLHEPRNLVGRDVLLVGGGQSAADVALHLLNDKRELPRRLIWTSGRTGFLPRDDSPFSNEWFNPGYTEYFQQLSSERRLELLEHQHLASDGASESALQTIYRRLYELDYLDPVKFDHQLFGGHRLIALSKQGGRYEALIHSPDTHEQFSVEVDTVILATGYRSGLPQLLAPLDHRLMLDEAGNYRIASDYRLEWDGPEDQGIFVQSAARSTHGVADPNLSLTSWRSAMILNKCCGREVYPLGNCDATLALRCPSKPLLTSNGEQHGRRDERIVTGGD